MSPSAFQRSRSSIRVAAAPAPALLGLLAALTLAACGSSHRRSPPAGITGARPSATATSTTSTSTTTGPHHNAAPRVVDIYSGLPLEGPLRRQGEAVRAGIELALRRAHDRAGIFSIHYTSLDDATRHGVNLVTTARNASTVAVDPNAVLYIGDLTSAATEVSLPVLNAARIPQVTPASPYVGLTEAVAGVTADHEPGIYQPSGLPTLLRLMPNDQVQAQDAVLALKGCLRVSAVAIHGTVGAGLVTMMATAAKAAGVNLVPYVNLTGKQASIDTYLGTLHDQPPTCFVIAARPSRVVATLTTLIHADYQRDQLILGTAALCNRRWTAAVSPAADPDLFCLNPILPLQDYPDGGGTKFAAIYRRAYHGASPSAWALYGYEAAKLGIDAIRKLNSAGNNRAILWDALTTRPVESYLGPYAFHTGGDTDLEYYGLYDVHHGAPYYLRTLNPLKSS